MHITGCFFVCNYWHKHEVEHYALSVPSSCLAGHDACLHFYLRYNLRAQMALEIVSRT